MASLAVGFSKVGVLFNGEALFFQDESEFRDKLTPITIFMEYRLDQRTAADNTGLQPILNQFTPANVSRQVITLPNLSFISFFDFC